MNIQSVPSIYHGAARQLIEQGWAKLPLQLNNIPGPDQLLEEFNALVDRRLEVGDIEAWSLHREGERPNERDIGFCNADPAMGKDDKITFHSAFDTEARKHELGTHGPDLMAIRLIRHCGDLRRVVLAQQYAVLRAVDELRGGQSLAPLHKAYFDRVSPYAAHTLRLIRYKAGGGKQHTDRGLLGSHLRDIGGVLYGIDLRTGEQVTISPEPGFVTLFWGEKAWWLTRDDERPLIPLEHGSTVEPGVVRFASVVFGHAYTERLITDAKEIRAERQALAA